MPDRHAMLTCSGSSKWLHCTPSARLELEFDEQTCEAAEIGTAAHSMGEAKIRKLLGEKVTRQGSIYDDDEMETCTDDYASFVYERYQRAKKLDPNAKIFLEVELDLSPWIREGFGTSDVVIVYKGSIEVIDFKYGMIVIDAVENSQMKLYSLGALRKYEDEFNVKRVSMTIFQPRRQNVSTWITTAAKIKSWATKEVVPKAKLAYEGKGPFVVGTHCTYCKCRNKCKALAEENLKAAKLDFKKPDLLSDTELAEILSKIPALKTWIDDLWEYATNEALKGKKFEGLKLVEATSRRKYIDEAKVVEACKAAGYLDIYKKVLISITEMEKYMGKKNFEDVLSNLVEKPQGKPTLVLESDKRPEMNIANIDFKEN